MRCAILSCMAIAMLHALPAPGICQESLPRPTSMSRGHSFPSTIRSILGLTSDAQRREAADILVAGVKHDGRILTGDSTIYFLYSGSAQRVSVAGDFNEWNPQDGTMFRVPGTDLFYDSTIVSPSSRIEYKFVVDSLWILDPLNPGQAIGGFGANSEIRMPEYRPPAEIEQREGIPHGTIDTLLVQSTVLGCAHPVLVYVPSGVKSENRFPVVFVTDGGEYLERARMDIVLDNLIADRRIRPVIAVFVDPRTALNDPRSNRRMSEYAMSDTFLSFLIDELRPTIVAQYRITTDPKQTAILGASLGGLISTYAAFRRPDVFGLCASQSPAYQIRKGEILDLLSAGERKSIQFYLETGTIHDAQVDARLMRDVFLRKGYPVRYVEVPEGHNWMNWRAHLSDFLTYFWGPA